MDAMPYKIKVTIGSNAFEAEGPEELVTKQYNAFLEAISAAPKQAPSIMESVVGSLTDEFFTPPQLAQIFLLENDGISLLQKPNTDNPKFDGILVLLYGYMALKNERFVKATDLLNSAKDSGLGLDRLDKIVKGKDAEISASGNRRGVRYKLKRIR